MVAIVQKSLPHYRRSFFDNLRGELNRRGVELRLVYGQPTGADASKDDTAEIPWATRIHNRTFTVAGAQVVWQPCLKAIRDADLVIVEQAAKLLVNYPLLIGQALGAKPVAFWGHGQNFQRPTLRTFAEKVKRLVSRHVHWWFAYNDLSAQVIADLGYPVERITSVQNAIDTDALREARDRLGQEGRAALRSRLGIRARWVAIYCGGLYREKRLEFLIEAGRRLATELGDFELVVIGSGPERERIERASAEHPWLRFLGPRFGDEKVSWFLASDVFLMPGLVGLAVLDAFALEVPLVTTADALHSPEIDYLVSGENGVVTPGELSAYVAEVRRILLEHGWGERLREGGRQAGARYTVPAMAVRFADGVVKALEAAKSDRQRWA